MKESWDSVSDLYGDPSIGAKIWKKVHRRVLARKYSWALATTVSVAAAACIVAAIFIWKRPDIETNEIPVRIVQVNSDRNQQVILPDGTNVYLEKGSMLAYPENMDNSREVELIGDAVFDVTKQPDGQNFIVRLESSYIEVKGTSFAVNTEKGKEVSVILYNGAVDFVATSNGQTISLKPSNRLSFNLEDQSMQVVPAFNGIVWKNGSFILKDAPLDSILGFIQWRYKVNISISKSVGKLHHLNGIINHDEVCDKVIEKFCYMLDLKFRCNEDGYCIYTE